ncbi:MAG: transcriptional repressor sdpR [Cyanobacteria bacterium RYN_339]|nr:transcriptional repressor sdpR [Cyanobacteria bacterium RYN_339]
MSADPFDQIFSALGDPTRRAVVARLAAGPCTVKALAEPFPLALPTFSKHLKVLEQAGLIERTVEGRFHTLRLVQQPLREATTWLTAMLGPAPAELRGFLAALPLAMAPPAADALAKARQLAQALRPRIAVIAAALTPTREAGFTPVAHRARQLAAQAHQDPALATHLTEALACFAELERALAAEDAGALEQAVLPAGQLAFTWSRHPVLREVAAS